MKLIFMGTPEFSVPFLQSLHLSHHTVSLVVTQPDKPKGRGQKLAAPPVKEKALELGYPVAQPVSLKTPEFHDLIRAQGADLLVVVAYRILPDTLFPLTRFGAVNMHGSLLPKFRGAAPIQWAVATGEKETGVTVFKLDREIDHGGILASAVTPIGPNETAGDLFNRLKELGKDVLMRVLDDMEAGHTQPKPQDHSASSPAPKLKKEDGRLDFRLSAQTLHNRVRGFNPYPICYGVTSSSQRILRIHSTRLESQPSLLPSGDFTGTSASLNPVDGKGGKAEPGTVSMSVDRYPLVATGDGWLKLMEVQWEGKPKVSGPDFLNGLQSAEREGLHFESPGSTPTIN